MFKDNFFLYAFKYDAIDRNTYTWQSRPRTTDNPRNKLKDRHSYTWLPAYTAIVRAK